MQTVIGKRDAERTDFDSFINESANQASLGKVVSGKGFIDKRSFNKRSFNKQSFDKSLFKNNSLNERHLNRAFVSREGVNKIPFDKCCVIVMALAATGFLSGCKPDTQQLPAAEPIIKETREKRVIQPREMKKQSADVQRKVMTEQALDEPQEEGPEEVEETRPVEIHEESPSSLPTTDIRVAVVDASFDADVVSDSNAVMDSVDIHGGSRAVTGTNDWHGNTVASIVPGGHQLDLIKVTRDNKVIRKSHVDYAVGLAAERGARVINASFSNRLTVSSDALTFNGVTPSESYRRVVDANAGKGAVYTVPAGNHGEAVDAGSQAIHRHQPELFRVLLMAVGTQGDGELHPDSNYPGDDWKLASRTLGAPYQNPLGGGGGTSFTSALLAGHAATLVDRWPHLSAAQISQRLLDTARKDSTLYTREDCGADGQTNCGQYYLGEGEVDLNAALSPSGELRLPDSRESIAGGHRLDTTSLRLGSAFGSDVIDRMPDLVAFDRLGRDYATSLSRRARPQGQRASRISDHLTRLMSAFDTPRKTRHQHEGYGFQVRLDDTGALLESRLSAEFGKADIGVFRLAGDQPGLEAGITRAGMMDMLSFQGSAGIGDSLDQITGVQSQYALDERFTLTASHWSAGLAKTSGPGMSGTDTSAADPERRALRPSQATGSQAAYRATRSDLGLDINLLPTTSSELTLSARLGQLDERQGLLGSHGRGALALDGESRTRFAGLSLDGKFSDTLSGFAEVEYGSGSARGQGLLTRLDDVSSQRMAMGLQWQGEAEQAALTLRQPLQVSQATATFDVPVGRQADGSVVRQRQTRSLSPSGRQLDLEFGYRAMLGENGQWGLNALLTLDPEHNASAGHDTAAMLHYRYRW